MKIFDRTKKLLRLEDIVLSFDRVIEGSHTGKSYVVSFSQQMPFQIDVVKEWIGNRKTRYILERSFTINFDQEETFDIETFNVENIIMISDVMES